jgi:hypothetical protein
MRALRRVLSAATIASLLIFVIAGLASAHISGKSIVTENGECLPGGEGTPECSAAAVYGPDGFSGQIFFDADQIGTTQTLYDYICVHTPDLPGSPNPFVSYGGTYQFALSEGGAPLGSSEETVTGGVPCTDGTNAVTSGSVAITVPADGSVDYTISIDGITSGTSAEAAFSTYNSILNRVVELGGNQANSVSVKPPTTFIIPEAPLAILLLLTGGIGAAWFVSRRMRSAANPIAA